MINLVNCHKTYIKNHKKIKVLNGANYFFESGHFYAIMGKSGSGKSTLINAIAGLLEIDSGQILIDKSDIIKMNNKEQSKIRSEKIGLVYQSYLLNEYISALDNILLALYLNATLSNEKRVVKAEALLESVGLLERKNHFPKELSGGEQQRVAIARALSNDPDIILADEPTGNLDKENEKYIFSLLKQLAKKGKCIIVVSHNEIIKEYADVVLVLKDGVLSHE